jgi:outer membrane lipoprotein-sorting protein
MEYRIAVLLMLGVSALAILSVPYNEHSLNDLKESLAESSIAASVVATSHVMQSGSSSENSFTTSNGLQLVVGKLRSSGDMENVLLPLSDKKINFPVKIQANTTWEYGRVKNVLFIPKDPSVIDTAKTSYYPTSDILEVSFDCKTPVNGLYIYSISGPPAVIISNTSMSWSYDHDTRITSISSSSLICNVIVYWDGLVSSRTAFIEDTRKIDNFQYSIMEKTKEVISAGKIAEERQKPVDKLGIELDKIQNKTDQVIFEKKTAESSFLELTETSAKFNKTRINLMNQTNELEEMVSARVLVSPLQAGMGFIVGLILIVLLIDVFFLRGDKNEKK